MNQVFYFRIEKIESYLYKLALMSYFVMMFVNVIIDNFKPFLSYGTLILLLMVKIYPWVIVKNKFVKRLTINEADVELMYESMKMDSVSIEKENFSFTTHSTHIIFRDKLTSKTIGKVYKSALDKPEEWHTLATMA